MKKWLALGVLAVAGFAAIAASCTITKIRLTEINGKDVFAGQVNNDSGADLLQHNIIVAFLDSNNNVLETKTVEGCLRSLQSGEADYFSVASTSSASNVATGLARLALDGNLKAGETADGDVVLSDIRVRRDGEDLRVTGTIKNEDNDELEDPKACIVVKDDDGNIVIVAKTNALADLDEDDDVDFTVNVEVVDDEDVLFEVDVFADGLEDGVPVAPDEDLDNDVTDCSDPTNTPTQTPTGSPTPVPPTATNTPGPGTPTNTPTTATSTATPCF